MTAAPNELYWLKITQQQNFFLFVGTNLKGESFNVQSSLRQTTNMMREIQHSTLAFMF